MFPYIRLKERVMEAAGIEPAQRFQPVLTGEASRPDRGYFSTGGFC